MIESAAVRRHVLEKTCVGGNTDDWHGRPAVLRRYKATERQERQEGQHHVGGEGRSSCGSLLPGWSVVIGSSTVHQRYRWYYSQPWLGARQHAP